WAFPPSFTPGGATVETVSGAEDIRQSLGILLNTVPGERVMQEGFGCDLPSLVFEELDQSLVGTVKRFIEAAIVRYEDRITLDRIDVAPDAEDQARLVINVYYTVIATNSRYNMVFPFYLTEATFAPGV